MYRDDYLGPVSGYVVLRETKPSGQLLSPTMTTARSATLQNEDS
jgi:hypothetical protein